MPQLGETVTEGTIIRWLKSVGDVVAVDDALFEVSTDKVDAEVPSAWAGVLREIRVAEGETVAVGVPLAVITETVDEPVVEESPEAATPETARHRAAPAPAAARPAPAPPAPNGNGFLSPVVRRLLDEHGLEASAVVGSGRDGRITRADVLAAAANARRAPVVAPGPPLVAVSPTVAPVAGPDDEVVEFTRARRTTAEHMTRSLRTSAHTLVGTAVDYHALEPVRREAGLSYLPFIGRAVVDALARFPRVNASVGADELIVHRSIHLGFAVDVDFEALVVPVVRDAGGLRLRAVADAVARLAAAARTKRLTADDLTGGTFTITNVGYYGTVVTFPVINQPQVAILSTDGVKMTPVAARTAAGDWTLAVHPVGNLSLAFDHRAFDGAYAAAFLAQVRDTLEQRDWRQEV